MRSSGRSARLRMTIRPATKDDIPRVLEMVRRFVSETIYSEILGDAKHAGRVLELSIMLGVTFVAERTVYGPFDMPVPDYSLSAVYEPRPTTVGFICAIAATNPISGLLVCEELAWWVEPEHRGSPAGPKLLRSLEDWARQKGCHMLKMVAPAESPEVARFYEKRGLRPAETAYFKRL